MSEKRDALQLIDRENLSPNHLLLANSRLHRVDAVSLHSDMFRCSWCDEFIGLPPKLHVLRDSYDPPYTCDGCAIHGPEPGKHVPPGHLVDVNTLYQLNRDGLKFCPEFSVADAAEHPDAVVNPKNPDESESLQENDLDYPLGELLTDVPEDDYFGADAVGSTPLRKLYANSVDHARVPVETTAAMRFGSLVHLATLEPDKWRQEVVELEVPVELTKSTHQKAAATLAEHGLNEDGRKALHEAFSYNASTIDGYYEDEDVRQMAKFLQDHPWADVTDEEREAAEAARDSIYSTLRAGENDLLLDEGLGETSVFWIDEDTGQLCRARYDVLLRTPYGTILGDLKVTSRGVKPRRFRYKIRDEALHLQAGHYLEGADQAGLDDVIQWLWITVESTEPYGVQLHRIDRMDDPEFFDKSRQHARWALRQWDDHETDPDAYGGLDPEINDISIPEDAWRDIE